jgi:tRNA-splicing ligase RtcB (3'-phosphate/5'-hydroxy nucleic acid ligase)
MNKAEKLKVFGSHDEATLRQIKTCLETGGEQAVLCADGHKGYAQPIGGVVAYEDSISLSGVGFDIACGNLACRTDAPASEVKTNIGRIMDDVVHQISFGVGRANKTPVDHELFDDPAWKLPEVAPLKELAREQLGTVGSGNHYVDIFLDEQDRVWVGVHFGSRGLGHKIATIFLQKSNAKDGMDVPPCVVPAGSPLGENYLEAMRLAGRYAYAGREQVCGLVVDRILGARTVESVHNHHNFAWREEHGSRKLWVVRKGATPAFPGQKGFVGGSMGDDAVILSGVDSPEARAALFSTIHGAGRIMSRTAAAGKVRWIRGKPVRQGRGRISPRDMQAWVEHKGVCLRGGGCDEAPQAYRRLPEVLKAHESTVRILHVLRPIGVAMAGEDVHDPYKD